MTNRLSLALPFLLAFAFQACQPGPVSRVGLDAHPADVDLSQDSSWTILTAAIDSAMAEGAIPGAVLLLARNGQVLGHEAFGVQDPITGDPMDKDGLFRICSMTKATTATAAMILWERGQIGRMTRLSIPA